MPPITKRRSGRGYESEIQSLQRLRTAIVIDDRIAVDLHSEALTNIDALVTTLGKLMRLGLNADSTPPPPLAGGPQTAPRVPPIRTILEEEEPEVFRKRKV